MKHSIFFRLVLVSVSFILSFMASAQTKVTVTGTVTDQSGQPVIGAGVFEKGTTNGVPTDSDGKYAISVNPGATLVYSCIGYAENQQKVTGAGTLNVVLADDATLLEETVVVGYGVQKKSDITGAIASVSSDALENRSVNDVVSALAGKTSGVQVISTSGQPGSVGTIRIRGVSSNSSSATSPLYIVDGLQVSNLNDLDPQNIKSIEVLKDAASAAIYGAQAGNGVVLITTKTGVKGEGNIFYNGSYTFEYLGYHPDMMNAEQYIDYMTTSGAFTQTLVDEYWDGETDTDWFKEVFPGGHAMRHTVGAQGANDKGSYYISLSTVNHNGILYGDKDTFKRLSVQLNADYKIKKWFKVGTTNTFSYRKTLAMDSVSGSDGSIMGRVFSMDPLTPVFYDEDNLPESIQDAIVAGYPVVTTDDGKYISATEFVSRTTNPLFSVYRYKNSHYKNYTLSGTTYVNLTPIKGLVFTSRFGYNLYAYDNYYYLDPYWISGTQNSSNYSIGNTTGFRFKYQWENFANYSITIADKHTIEAMAGMEYIESNTYYTSGTTNELKDYAENFRYLSYSTTDANDTVSGAPSRSASLSYFGRLGYNYDNRYFIQGSFRADAFDSSYLSKDNRWGYFPSVSVGWNITNEPYMQNINKDILSFLKLRASYGTNGNIAALGSSYLYDSTVTIGASNYQMTSSEDITLASYPTSASNSSLKWETSKQFDLGLDARFFNDRLAMTLDYYNKDTDDLIVQVTPSYTTGQSSTYLNAGSVNNKGIELELDWKDTIGDFSYSISGNIAHNTNKVTYLVSSLTRINGAFISNNHYGTAFEEGYPVWYMRGFKFDGVDPDDGSPIFEDINGDGTIDESDQTKIGSAQPDFTYGITINAAWKNFDLTIFGSGSQGNDIWFGMLRSDCADRNLPSVFYTDAWKQAGDNARYPKYGDEVSTYYYRSSGCIYDGSYFRINQIQLGYTLPQKVLKFAKMKNVRFYVSMDDFFTFSKYIGFDPSTCGTNSSTGLGVDVGNYPTSRKVMLGVNVSF